MSQFHGPLSPAYLSASTAKEEKEGGKKKTIRPSSGRRSPGKNCPPAFTRFSFPVRLACATTRATAAGLRPAAKGPRRALCRRRAPTPATRYPTTSLPFLLCKTAKLAPEP
jgi:hypothetical protein